MRRLFELKCSSCRYRAAVKATSTAKAGEEFERCGWKVDGPKIKCPACIKKEAEAPTTPEASRV